MRISLFSLAILFTGFEFDNTILALVLSGGGLEQVALGTALGTGLAIIGITLALAAIVRPFLVDHKGELKRWQGYLLGGLYVAYWIVALVVFSGVPIGE